jgi:hypothetical protein
VLAMGEKNGRSDLVPGNIESGIHSHLVEMQRILHMKTAMFRRYELLNKRYNEMLIRLKELEQIENQ